MKDSMAKTNFRMEVNVNDEYWLKADANENRSVEPVDRRTSGSKKAEQQPNQTDDVAEPGGECGIRKVKGMENYHMVDSYQNGDRHGCWMSGTEMNVSNNMTA